MQVLTKTTLMLTTLLSMVACETPIKNAENTFSSNATSATPETAEQSNAAAHSGLDLNAISKTVRPGDDFYRYTNEGWLATATVPAGLNQGNAVTEAMGRTTSQINAIFADLRSGTYPVNTSEGQIKALYESYLDTKTLDKLGVSPLMPELTAIFNAATHKELARVMGQSLQIPLIGIKVMLDEKEPGTYRLAVGQNLLGLLDTTIYTHQDQRSATLRDDYVSYIGQLFQLAGIDKPKLRAKKVLAFELALIKNYVTAENYDGIRAYHKMRRPGLIAEIPGIDWTELFSAWGVADQDTLLVPTVKSTKATVALFAQTDLDILKNYQVFRLLHAYAPYLTTAFKTTSDAFLKAKLYGIEPTPRESAVNNVIDNLLGESLGKIYVKRYFPETRKAEVKQLVDYALAAYRKRIQNLSWMDPETRQEALAKIAGMTVKIGYPDQWHYYSNLRLTSNTLFNNYRQIIQWQHQDELAKLKTPVRKWEWAMSPQTVNAYYNPIGNEIVVGAAHLQAPLYDANAEPAVKFGTLVATIGHELSHAFDTKGSQYDAKSILRNWWSPSAKTEYLARSNLLIDQYNHYSPIAGLNLNGKTTLTENSADLGGLNVAFDAYQAYVADHFNGVAPNLAGFTGDQRFFLAYAKYWRTIYPEATIRSMIGGDEHSPTEFRVNGVVRNMDAWYKAFNVTAKDKMYLPPEQRVKIW